MAGTVVITEITHVSPKKIGFVCTTGTGGDSGKVDATTTEVYSGKLIAVTTVPQEALTAAWDLRLLDADGVDLLAAGGVDRNTTATQHVAQSSLGAVVVSALTLEVRAAGDTKTVNIYVYIR